MNPRSLVPAPRGNLWGLWCSAALLLALIGPAQAADLFSFQWEQTEDSEAINWPQRQLPAPDSILQVSPAEARARVQALFPDETWDDFRLIGADQHGILYAQAKNYHIAHLLRSRDGGSTWELIWERAGKDVNASWLLPKVSALVVDPRNAGQVLIGTTAGLFLNNEALITPPGAGYVAALALQPLHPEVLYLASGVAGSPLRVQGLYRRRTLDQQSTWEDLSPNLPAVIGEIGFDPQDPRRVYVRTVDGLVYGHSFPEQIRPEDLGWEVIPNLPSHLQYATPITDPVADALRVPLEYPRKILTWYDVDRVIGFDRYLLALGGVLFAQNIYTKVGLLSVDIYRSRDGGFSWERSGQYSKFGSYFSGYPVIWDNQGRLRVVGGLLPGILTERLGTWNCDPLDRSTLYVAQQGRGMLYRSQELDTWEEVSLGLDPMGSISGIAIDSLAHIYLRAGKQILHRQGTPHPFRLTAAHLQPDTLSPGNEMLISARPVPHAGHQGAFAGTVTAVFATRRYPLADPDGDGVYTTAITLSPDYPVGFDGVGLFLDIPGQPLGRVSERLPVMVVPSRTLILYHDRLYPDWQASATEGALDLEASRAFAGRSAIALKGELAFQYLGAPIHPFGYTLEFYAAGTPPEVAALQVNGQSLPDLKARTEPAGDWTHIAIPAEMLNKEPAHTAGDYFYDQPYPPHLKELRFRSSGALYLDEIQLRSLRALPLRAFWNPAIPDTVLAGTPFRVGGVVYLTQFDTQAPPPLASVDLSQLGGPRALALEPAGTDSFSFSAVLVDTVPGIKTIALSVRQQTQLGLAEETFSQRVVVLWGIDDVIYGEGLGPSWSQGARFKAEVFPETQEQVFRGNKALKSEVNGDDYDFTFVLQTATPRAAAVYQTVHFACRPGDLTVKQRFVGILNKPDLNLSINGHEVPLANEFSGQVGGYRVIDLSRQEWQVIEIPLSQWKLGEQEKINSVSFTGNTRGFFYLDDLRLLALQPSTLPPTVVAETREAALPQTFRLDPNYPNPFNSSTTFRFALPASARTELVVYNLAGQRVATLLAGPQEAGVYTLQWDGRDQAGRELATGVYLYRLQAGAQVELRKLLLLR